MHSQHGTVTMSSSVYNRFNRMKSQGQFNDDQDLLQAAFEALDREWHSGLQSETCHQGHVSEPYMKHPGLSPDDYDT